MNKSIFKSKKFVIGGPILAVFLTILLAIFINLNNQKNGFLSCSAVNEFVFGIEQLNVQRHTSNSMGSAA